MQRFFKLNLYYKFTSASANASANLKNKKSKQSSSRANTDVCEIRLGEITSNKYSNEEEKNWLTKLLSQKET